MKTAVRGGHPAAPVRKHLSFLGRVALAAAAAAVVLAGCTPSTTPRVPTSTAAQTISLPADTAGVTGAAPGAASTAAAPSATAHAQGRTHARTATILGSGDVLIHPQLWQQAHADADSHGYDFGPMYASIAPDVRAADLATCELETPLAPPQGPFAGWPTFSAPPQVLTALHDVGYRTCTTASNHSIDQGYSGLQRTLDELDHAGLRHTGSARSAAEARRPLLVTLPNGVRIGQLAYSFGFNGIPVPADKPWLANLIDVPRILVDAHRAKQSSADIVVVSMHWGTEYDHLATVEQRSQSQRLLASPDVDLILGDHAHVVQPAQRIHGKWVFYCMGNQISRHADPIAESREGVMPRVTFTETSPHRFRVSRAEAIATWMQDSPNLRLIDLPRALAATSSPRAEQSAAHAAIIAYLDAYGAIKDGLQVP